MSLAASPCAKGASSAASSMTRKASKKSMCISGHPRLCEECISWRETSSERLALLLTLSNHGSELWVACQAQYMPRMLLISGVLPYL